MIFVGAVPAALAPMVPLLASDPQPAARPPPPAPPRQPEPELPALLPLRPPPARHVGHINGYIYNRPTGYVPTAATYAAATGRTLESLLPPLRIGPQQPTATSAALSQRAPAVPGAPASALLPPANAPIPPAGARALAAAPAAAPRPRRASAAAAAAALQVSEL